jgi:hypothetical protein
MPTEAKALAATVDMHPVAARRILRLALGTALCLLVSQIVNWPLAFIAPVLTLTLLGLPFPAPGLKKGMAFVIAILAPMVMGLALVPFLQHARWAGIVLVAMALYYSFYYTARGGSAALGTFMTIGLTVVVTVGSVNSTLLIVLIQSLGINAVFGLVFVWLAHALLPDPPELRSGPSRKPPAPAAPLLAEARRKALRSMLIVLPLALLFLFMSGSPAYTVVMIKVASMGQQASSDSSREMGRSMFASTFWGGLAAVIGWNLLSVWPSLVFYVLLVAVSGLVFGRRMFQGMAVYPDFSKWSYAYLTLIVLLAPAVLDSPFGSDAGSAFWSRLFLFGVIAVYGTAAVAVFDAFWPDRSRSPEAPELSTRPLPG